MCIGGCAPRNSHIHAPRAGRRKALYCAGASTPLFSRELRVIMVSDACLQQDARNSSKRFLENMVVTLYICSLRGPKLLVKPSLMWKCGLLTSINCNLSSTTHLALRNKPNGSAWATLSIYPKQLGYAVLVNHTFGCIGTNPMHAVHALPSNALRLGETSPNPWHSLAEQTRTPSVPGREQ